MRFSVECAFPYLGKRRAISRKSAFCVRFLTEKRTLHKAVRETPRTYGNNLAQAMAMPKHSAAMTQVMQMDLLPSPFTLPVTTAIRATSTEKLPTVVRLSVSTACRSTYAAWALAFTKVKMPARMAMIAITLPYILLSTNLSCSIRSRIFMSLNNMV